MASTSRQKASTGNRIRVVLVAHGEAASAGLIENFRISWRTLGHAAHVMRLPAPLRLMICTLGSLRKRFSNRPGSIHNDMTRRQAIALQQALGNDPDNRYEVVVAFASAPPYTEALIADSDTADRQFMLSMIPSDSRLSCGLICHPLKAAGGTAMERTSLLARLWDSPKLTSVHCEHIAQHFPAIESGAPCCLVLVLHGTVVEDTHGNKPDFHTGEAEKAEYADALKTALMAMPERQWQRVELAYVNHGVGGQWSSPTLPELLARLDEEGVGSVVAYACEHLVDGGETSQLPQVLAAGPVPETHCLPCLNLSPPFIEFLAERVREALIDPGIDQRCGPCPLNRA
ncbi:MAG: ferrochelatase [Wenzhouxiangella sp.]|jgi:ferrochelatase|nr:ferrochelatase [Wenzhouxiangella sp.]